MFLDDLIPTPQMQQNNLSSVPATMGGAGTQSDPMAMLTSALQQAEQMRQARLSQLKPDFSEHPLKAILSGLARFGGGMQESHGIPSPLLQQIRGLQAPGASYGLASQMMEPYQGIQKLMMEQQNLQLQRAQADRLREQMDMDRGMDPYRKHLMESQAGYYEARPELGAERLNILRDEQTRKTDQGNRRLDQGDVKLGQGDTKLDQGNRALDQRDKVIENNSGADAKKDYAYYRSRVDTLNNQRAQGVIPQEKFKVELARLNAEARQAGVDLSKPLGNKAQTQNQPSGKTVRVVGPDGNHGSLPADQLDEALKGGFRLE